MHQTAVAKKGNLYLQTIQSLYSYRNESLFSLCHVPRTVKSATNVTIFYSISVIKSNNSFLVRDLQEVKVQR